MILLVLCYCNLTLRAAALSHRFAAALIDQPLWVMNVVPIDAPDTLSIIFDRGLIGMYHDWCESFNTYPRTYDLLHSSFLLSDVTQRYCFTNPPFRFITVIELDLASSLGLIFSKHFHFEY